MSDFALSWELKQASSFGQINTKKKGIVLNSKHTFIHVELLRFKTSEDIAQPRLIVILNLFSVNYTFFY